MLAASETLIECRNIRVSRGSHVVFKNVSLQIPRGKVTAVMGPSGSGKTTLLRLIGGQLAPDSGTVSVEDQSIYAMTRPELYRLRKRMGMMFQNSALFSDLTVFENVAFPLREHTNLTEDLIRDLVLMKLQAVGLRGARDLMPSSLSGGMARRVALARAIALDPAILMFDEPFAGQDPISMGILMKLIRFINDALHLTTIVVSHDVQEILSIADYLYIMADGEIIGAGSPQSLRIHGNEKVRQFLNGLPDGPIPFHYPAPDYAEDLWGSNA